MSRDGQTLRDYGEHQGPEADWNVYEECPRCKVERGQACLDMRFKHMLPEQLWKPHKTRPVVNVLEGRVVLDRLKKEV